MKLEKTENTVKLIAETPFEEECLHWIANKQLTAKFEDNWNNKGALVLEFEKHSWDTQR